MHEPLLTEPDVWWRFERVEVQGSDLVGVGNPVPYRLRDTLQKEARGVPLHHLFERLETAQDMAAFATRYGLLGLRHALVWSLQVRPVRGFDEVIRHADGRLEVREKPEATGLRYEIVSSPYAPPLREVGRLLTVGGALKNNDPWRESIAEWQQEAEWLRRAFVLLSEVDPSECSDPHDFAYIVAHLVESRLLSVRRVLVWDGHKRQWRSFDSPGTLLAAIWLSLWQNLRVGVTFGVCQACGFHFPRRRVDQRYCPPEFNEQCSLVRKAAYRQRHAEVLREAARRRRRGEPVSLPELRRILAKKKGDGSTTAVAGRAHSGQEE